ncbi:tRNA (adenine(22)-N(1))-methyltransferase [Paenibacillus beijingensis]|uniref:SAM-dependent methyltransferase n=1 Tax=Paenibacillus beijingensis TaxID=1126833 RepID=A0A0D5NMV6_9BACL|nr:class I SAM-dependent methyltransferase [Paenibacillus beijingensis]AJY76337.1 SAM-dependent methyltransferase [Paenibacillus beijingensis]
MLMISKRLASIAAYVTPGSRVADIGSDHALLPIFLVQSGKVPSAIAGELNAGPLEAARKGTAAAGLSAKIQVRQGDGLAVLQPGEADTITISGMGGSLIRTILQDGNEAGKLAGVKELVLQPNVGEEFVRAWLLDNGWYLQDEHILEEDGKIYEVLHARKPADAASLNDKLYGADQARKLRLRMGPYLLGRPTDVLERKWNQELDKLGRIIGQLSQSDLPEARAKENELLREMREIEEVLSCLPKDKR